MGGGYNSQFALFNFFFLKRCSPACDSNHLFCWDMGFFYYFFADRNKKTKKKNYSNCCSLRKCMFFFFSIFLFV